MIPDQKDPLPPGVAWFVCRACGDRWAMPEDATVSCGECRARDGGIVPMDREDRRKDR